MSTILETYIAGLILSGTAAYAFTLVDYMNDKFDKEQAAYRLLLAVFWPITAPKIIITDAYQYIKRRNRSNNDPA